MKIDQVRRVRRLEVDDNAKTAQKNRIVEKKLMNKLDQLVTLIRKDTNNFDDKSYGIDIFFLNSALNQRLTSIIRHACQESYEIGIEYVTTQILNIENDSYLTSTDLRMIKNTTNEYVPKFWNRVEALRNTSQGKISGERQNPATNSNFIVSSLAVPVCTSSLNAAILQKSRKLIQVDGFAGRIKRAGILRTLNPVNMAFLFTPSMDDKASDRCNILPAGIWRIDNPNIPLILHNNDYRCRCRLTLVEYKDEVASDCN